MAQPVKSPYSKIRDEALTKYRTYLTGSDDGLLCVVSYAPLGETAATAIANSAQRFGYQDSSVYITIESGEDGRAPLDGPSLLELVEAIDPLGIVATDALACEMLSQGYHRPLTFNEVGSLLGRPCCCFSSFADMIADDDAKKEAWHLLKVLAQRM